MPLEVVTEEGKSFFIHSPQDFEKVFKVGYLPKVAFDFPKTEDKIQKLSSKASQKEWITPRQKWLGNYYGRSMQSEVHLDLTIAWIDETVGYGVWTNRQLPAHAFIGEYTGLIRRRRFFGRWKNRYCFDYNFKEGKSSKYVIDAESFGNHTRFINHSLEANLEPASIYWDGLLHVILYAPKEIPAGTQLCYDYGEQYWKKRSAPVNLTSR